MIINAISGFALKTEFFRISSFLVTVILFIIVLLSPKIVHYFSIEAAFALRTQLQSWKKK